MAAGHFSSNSDRANGINPSTATVPTSRSAAAPIGYSNDMSRLRVKLRRAATASRRKVSISTPSIISASPTRAATAASRGLRPSRPMPPLAKLSRNQTRRTRSARSPAGETIGLASFKNLPGASSGGKVNRSLALEHPTRHVCVTYWRSKIRRPLGESASIRPTVPAPPEVPASPLLERPCRAPVAFSVSLPSLPAWFCRAPSVGIDNSF